MIKIKKAIVLGATGSMGNALVRELVDREIKVVAFARNEAKLKESFAHLSVQIFAGDVFKLEDLMEAMEGVDVVFHAINIPYQEWKEKQPILLRNIVTAVQRTNTKLVMIDNIYAYGRSRGLVKEEQEKLPHTKKGKIRLELERMAKESGVPLVIAHLPDFYGPYASSTLLDYTLQSVVKNKKAMYVGDQRKAREFIYLPDGAKAVVELAMRADFNGDNWNIPGAGTVTGYEIRNILKQAVGYDKKVTTITKNMIRFLGLFNPFMKEYVEMYYLNEEPVLLSGEKYEKYIGPIPKTSYKEGITETLLSLKKSVSS